MEAKGVQRLAEFADLPLTQAEAQRVVEALDRVGGKAGVERRVRWHAVAS